MNWDKDLRENEKILWQGRPAPRCFTFRNWKHSVFGLIFLMLTTFWEAVGLQLSSVYSYDWLIWLPIPFILFSLYLSFGHILLARLEWEQVFYAVTDLRVLARRGLRGQRLLSLELSAIASFEVHPQGDDLGTVRIQGDGENVLILSCIEYPRQATRWFETATG